jgi:hypothetical protein
VVPANAQEDVYAGFFIQKAESGTMTDNGDGTYTLALQGVGNSFEWLVTSPNAGLGYVDNGEVALDWASVPDGLEATAILETQDATLSLTLTGPEYDSMAGSFSYNATIIVPEGEKDVPAVPEFDAATLYIVADTAFVNGLATGAQNSGARPSLECTKVYYPVLGWLDSCVWVP